MEPFFYLPLQHVYHSASQRACVLGLYPIFCVWLLQKLHMFWTWCICNFLKYSSILSYLQPSIASQPNPNRTWQFQWQQFLLTFYGKTNHCRIPVGFTLPLNVPLAFNIRSSPFFLINLVLLFSSVQGMCCITQWWQLRSELCSGSLGLVDTQCLL